MAALTESALIDGADWAAAFTVKIFDIKEITAKVTNDPKDGGGRIASGTAIESTKFQCID
jgi:hypothetical protein